MSGPQDHTGVRTAGASPPLLGPAVFIMGTGATATINDNEIPSQEEAVGGPVSYTPRRKISISTSTVPPATTSPVVPRRTRQNSQTATAAATTTGTAAVTAVAVAIGASASHLSAPVDPGLSPILNRSPQPFPHGQPQSPRPEFAELLTPDKLRRKRRHIPHVVLPPSAAGPSRGGWQTEQGDVYRGASTDPTAMRVPTSAQVEEDALTFSGSSGSSSSSGSTWSIVSDLERGRRRTVAAFERLGERIGVRRGSDSTTSVDSTRLDHAHELRHHPSRRRLSLSRRLTRTLTRRSSIDSNAADAPRREYRPRKREFVLLLPEGEGEGDRIISTPSLPVVLDRVRGLRVKAGLAVEGQDTTPAPSRGGSGRGHQRRPQAKRSQTSFARPPIPRTMASAQHTPLARSPIAAPVPSGIAGAVSATGVAATKPKSVSDLLHLPSPASAPNLTALVPSQAPTFPSNQVSRPAGTGSRGRGSGPGAWWLDVSCPTWEDLRDIGELLSLHPLTLEDVLQQDPREKLDMFDKLGYYFVMVRALDETYFKYTPGRGAVESIGGIGKASPAMSAGSGGSGSTVDKEEEKAVNGTNGNGEKSASPDMDNSNEKEKQKEGRRRGWGMGRAVGKLAARQGEKVEIVEDNPGREGLEGVGVGAVNVYLAVFADGVVSFHYDDISKHTDRVRDRILSLAGGTEHTSDWVAHGLIDSIVDAFFPLIRYVDGEVDDIDSLTIDPSVDPRAPKPLPENADTAAQAEMVGGGVEGRMEGSPPVFNEKAGIGATSKSDAHAQVDIAPSSSGKGWFRSKYGSEKVENNGGSQIVSPSHLVRSRILPSIALSKPRFAHWRWRWPIHFSHSSTNTSSSPTSNSTAHHRAYTHMVHSLIYLRLFFLPISSAIRKKHQVPEPIFDRTTMLRRITDLRRLVTGLTRLLGTKHQVIGRMRKRAEPGSSVEVNKEMMALATATARRSPGGAFKGDGGGSAVAAYIGDVEDHILLLQTSLLHYEYILAHCQPAYLSQLSVSFHITRGGISRNILALSTVTVSILPMQLLTRTNVRVPRDGDHDHLDSDGNLAGYNTFGITTVIVFFIVCGIVGLVRWWRWTARRKFAERRGVDVPGNWEGYWGWK